MQEHDYSQLQMSTPSKAKKWILQIVIALVVIAAVWRAIDRVNFWYRQQWHVDLTMQDLPPGGSFAMAQPACCVVKRNR